MGHPVERFQLPFGMMMMVMVMMKMMMLVVVFDAALLEMAVLVIRFARIGIDCAKQTTAIVHDNNKAIYEYGKEQRIQVVAFQCECTARIDWKMYVNKLDNTKQNTNTPILNTSGFFMSATGID